MIHLIIRMVTDDVKTRFRIHNIYYNSINRGCVIEHLEVHPITETTYYVQYCYISRM